MVRRHNSPGGERREVDEGVGDVENIAAEEDDDVDGNGADEKNDEARRMSDDVDGACEKFILSLRCMNLVFQDKKSVEPA